MIRHARPVLLVEDDPDIREATAAMLEVRGFTVVEAHNGLHALEWLQEGVCPCVILLDLMMPVMDGSAFLDALEKFEGEASESPVIVVTASHNPCEPRARAILRKPFSVDQFDEAVAEACQARG